VSSITGTVPFSVEFTNLSQGVAGFTKWEFGDGTTDYSENPTHEFSESGVFSVQLTIPDYNGNELICVRENYIAVFENEPLEKGDVSGDGAINVLDIVQTVSIILEQTEPTEFERWCADVNFDGVVNVLDILQIVNLILQHS